MSDSKELLSPPELSRESSLSDAVNTNVKEFRSLSEMEIELELARLKICQLDREITLENLRQNSQLKIADGKPTESMTGGYGLPKQEILKFYGDPLRYWTFIRNFDVSVDQKSIDDQSKLVYLIQYCEGDAKEVVEDCVIVGGTEGYRLARERLKKRFGQNHMIARAHIDRLLDGPTLGAKDSLQLMKLSQQMKTCETTLSQLGFDSDLNASRTLESIVLRLPVHLRFKWAEIAADCTYKYGEPKFIDLCEFVEKQAEIANTRYGLMASATSTSKVYPTTGRSDGYHPPLARKSAHAIQSNEVPITRTSSIRPCVMCSNFHFLDLCPEFNHLSAAARIIVTNENRLCRVCLKPNHTARVCRFERYCTVAGCGKRHHSLLHEEVPGTQEATVNFQKFGHYQQPIALAVVPVILKNGNQSVETLAFIDSGSDTTLVDETLVKRIGLSGKSTTISLSTMTGTSVCECSEVALEIQALDGSCSIKVKKAWTAKRLPNIQRFVPTVEQRRTWKHLSEVPLMKTSATTVGVLIGSDIPDVHQIIEQRAGASNEPFAACSCLGWMIMGPVLRHSERVSVNFLETTNSIEVDLRRMYDQEFEDKHPDDKCMSIDDRKALKMLENSVCLKDGHYEIALPWKSSSTLPNNRIMALKRLISLRKRLETSPKLKEMYCNTMESYFLDGYAEAADDDANESDRIWFLPHHPVTHPLKPNKIRIVFDCAAKYENVSLNDYLYSGPDLNNNLCGVLTRFRQNPIAVTADIRAMFHQVHVPPADRNALRFLWWKEKDMTGNPKEYRMRVHVFGATSSPCCAAFALKRTLEVFNASHYPSLLAASSENFYVDDYLVSFETIDEAKLVLTTIAEVLKSGGFELTKWTTNVPDVLVGIPVSELGSEKRCFGNMSECAQRTLGIDWNISKDSFTFRSQPMTDSATRRHLLSYVSSIFDPLGLVSPMLLPAKFILQQLSRVKYDWDDVLPEEELNRFNIWQESLKYVTGLKINRCFKPANHGPVENAQLHVFCDACERGYGAVVYLRLLTEDGHIKCSLVMAKSRVAPIKIITLPRLELVAAVLAVRLSEQVQREFRQQLDSVTYWTDSMIVLKSIQNTTRRFKTFVANRIAVIHELSIQEQWRHVDTLQNPADLASRGFLANNEVKCLRWLNGPEFLWTYEDNWSREDAPQASIPDEFVKISECNLMATRLTNKIDILSYYAHISDWTKLKRCFCWLHRYKTHIEAGANRRHLVPTGKLTVAEMEKAEESIIKLLQRACFWNEIQSLEKHEANIASVKLSSYPRESINQLRAINSRLRKLTPIIVEGVLRVGGRLQFASIPFQAKHPVILPSEHFVTSLIIRHIHTSNGHVGASHVLASLAERFCVIKARATVQRVLRECFYCKRWFAAPCQQAMAPLPPDRLQFVQPPFTITGVDYFGPFFVKRGRSTEKRFGCIFTCMTMRAVHIEVAHSLDTNSFLCAFTRFAARRGCPRKLYSDNGLNFRGAESEIRMLLKNHNQNLLTNELLKKDCDWVFNPPKASHWGGAWERLIRSIRRVMRGLLANQAVSDEVLTTTLAEVERILNDRPLIRMAESTEEFAVLTPNKLLLLQGGEPVVSSQSTESILNRRWKQANHLANEFWRSWIKLYLPMLNVTQKWLKIAPNIKVGDLVLMNEVNVPRGQWLKAIVEETKTGPDGLVREAFVRTSTGRYRRDVRSLCLLEAGVEQVGVQSKLLSAGECKKHMLD